MRNRWTLDFVSSSRCAFPGTLEDLDEAADRAAGLLAFEFEKELLKLGSDVGASPVDSIGTLECVEPAASPGVEPRLDRPLGDASNDAVGILVLASSGFLDNRPTITVLEASADERSEYAESPKRPFTFLVALHCDTPFCGFPPRLA